METQQVSRRTAMTGAELVIQLLKAHSVARIFGYPGGAIMPIYDAIYDSGLTHHLCRHEQGGGFSAIGYARASGQLGVCLATSGPGATNIITALADALLDSVPLLAITGQVSQSVAGTDAFQEVDVLGMSFTVCKHSFLVKDVSDVAKVLCDAIALAQHGRPGPVLIDIPKDVQLATVPASALVMLEKARQEKAVRQHAELNSVPISNMSSNMVSEPLGSDMNSAMNSAMSSATPTSTTTAAPDATPDLNAWQHALRLLRTAKQPVAYIGGGVQMADAITELRTWLTATGIPAVSTLKALGTVDTNYPFDLGMLGMHGNAAANLAVQRSDLLICCGARFDDRVTGNLAKFAPHAKVIQLEIDRAEIHKLRYADAVLHGDLKQLLPQLLTHSNAAVRAHPDWQQQCVQLKQQHAWRYDHPGEQIYAPLLLNMLSAKLPATAVVSCDVGQHQMWVAQHMRFHHPRNHLSSGGLGTMGFGLPAAIGAQLARPQDTSVLVTGDGSFMMNVQELASIKRYQLPVKIIVLDNQKLGMVKQWQQLFFQQRYSETDLSDNPDFVALASAFAIPGARISRKDEVADALDAMLHWPGPYLLHVQIDANDNVWPLVPPGAANDAMLTTGESSWN
jgi:acetolactate synthase-1/2/3 large subunit